MSRALVLVAGLYVFLSLVVINKRGNKDERKQVLKVATDMNKAKVPQTIELLSVPYVLLFDIFYSLLLFFSFIFFVQSFFSCFCSFDIFFSARSTQE